MSQQKKIIFFLVSTILVATGVFGLGQQVSGQSIKQKEAKLRADLAATEAEIKMWQTELRGKQQESASFQRDVDILNAKIKEAQASIRAGNIKISNLGKEISNRLENISQLDEKVDKGRESLSQLIRRTDEINSFSLVEIMLSNNNLSEFLIDLDDFDSVNKALHLSFREMRDTKRQLEVEKEQLGIKVNRETDIKKATEAEKRKVEQNEAERKALLKISRNQERTYEQVIIDREKKAAQIRATLFVLRDTAAIPFGDALKFAEGAFKQTGVRPAFLLAILTQESNLGANVGTCNRPQDSKKWYDIMPGPDDIAKGWSRRNDQAAYLRIIKELGLQPESMPLSCPWGNGWGGAMGPSQFIPTTWESYKSKVATALGKSIANPWEPRDAIMASGIYLGELGAGAGGYTAERTAALRYYAGGNWNNPKNAFYGDQVMAHAQRIQETMIDPLSSI